jgi:hypothetical protein
MQLIVENLSKNSTVFRKASGSIPIQGQSEFLDYPAAVTGIPPPQPVSASPNFWPS